MTDSLPPDSSDKAAAVSAAPPAGAEASSAAMEASASWWQRTRAGLARRARTTGKFAKELMHEHEFWVHALAVKGGASAALVAGVLAVSYLVAAPFMIAAAGIAAAGAVIGLGVYGMVAGSVRSWYRLRKIYAKATGKPLPQKPEKTGPNWVERQCARPGVKKVLETPVVKGFLNSRAWKMTKKFTLGQQDNVLGGLAVGGAALSLALGAVALATQILVLPVIALGGLLTVAAVTATSYVISGVSGLYFGIVGIKHMRAKKRAKAAAAAAAAAQEAAAQEAAAPEAAEPDAAPDAAAPAIAKEQDVPKLATLSGPRDVFKQAAGSENANGAGPDKTAPAPAEAPANDSGPAEKAGARKNITSHKR